MATRIVAAVMITAFGLTVAGCDRDDTNSAKSTSATPSEGMRTRSAENAPANVAAQAHQTGPNRTENDTTRTHNVKNAENAAATEPASSPTTTPANH